MPYEKQPSAHSEQKVTELSPNRPVVVAVIAAALGVGLTVGAVAAFVGPNVPPDSEADPPDGPEAQWSSPVTPSPGRTTPAPTATNPSTATPKPAKAVEVKLVPDKLKRSEGTVSYWDGPSKSFINGGVKTPFAAEPGIFVDLDSNYAAATFDDPNKVTLTGEIGSQVVDKGTMVTGPVASVDRTRFAWTVASRDGGNATLVVADATTGKPIYRIAVGNPVSETIGFLGDKVAVATSEDAPILIDPATGKKTFLKSERVIATAPSAGLVAVGTKWVDDPTGNGKLCTAILDGPDGESMWESCDLSPIGFSPNGRYVVTQPADTEGAGPLSYTVIDLRTKAPMLKLRAEFLGSVAWEQGGEGFTVLASGGGKIALVNCDLAGKCTSATKPRAFAGPGEDVFYTLPSN